MKLNRNEVHSDVVCELNKRILLRNKPQHIIMCLSTNNSKSVIPRVKVVVAMAIRLADCIELYYSVTISKLSAYYVFVYERIMPHSRFTNNVLGRVFFVCPKSLL